MAKKKKKKVTHYTPYKYTKSNEWNNWYGGDWGNYRTPGKSASSFWASSSWSSTADESWKFKNILYNIANAANVPANSLGKGERQLRVKWADNRKDADEHEEGTDNANSIAKDTIILSPDVVGKESRRVEWSEGEKQDVLIADALTLAAMKSTGSLISEAQINAEKRGLPGSPHPDSAAHLEIGKMADRLWTAQENIVAEKAVLENYPGFKSYYATYRDYWTDKEAREELEQTISEANEQGVNWIDGAVAATRYEMIYPDRKLELPDVYREAVEAAKSAMPLDANKDFRGSNAIRAAEEILRLLPQERENKKNKDSQSGEEGSKQKDAGGGSKMDQAPKFGEGRDSLGQQEKNTDLKPERDSTNKRVAKSDLEGVKLNDTIDRMILDEDTWKGGTDHVNVKVIPGCKDGYRQLVSSLKITINSMKNRLKLRQEKPNLMLHGLRRGGIDEGSLYKLAFHEPEPLIFEQPEIINRIDMAFAILIDESGSMAGQAHGSKEGKRRVEVARDVAIVLSESLRGNDGLELAVLGHTAQYNRQDGESHGVAIHHYMTPDNPHVETLARSNSFGNNLDGYAILETVRKMLKWYPLIDHRTIFVVSDGQPAGDGYGDKSARQHMFRVCAAARRAGVNIYGIGIDNAYSPAIGEAMYGRGNFVVLKNAVDSMALLCNFVVSAVRKTCVLEVQ